jgi:hypothetical protein
MAAPNDPKLGRLRVSSTETGTYANVGYVKSVELNRGSDGAKTLTWLGGQANKSGDRTLEGTVPIYWDDADTTGQQILEAAWESGDTVWLQFCPKGTATTAKVKQFQATITAAPITIDPTADAVEGSFTYKGDPTTLSTVTLA